MSIRLFHITLLFACPHLSTKKLATNRTCIHYLDVWFRWVEEAEGLVAGVEEVLVNPDPAVPTLVAANLQPLDIKENNVQALKITSDPVGTWKCKHGRLMRCVRISHKLLSILPELTIER